MDSTDSDSTAQSWMWLVDVERACSLLIGRCLGGMLVGFPLTTEEVRCRSWMDSALFSGGAEPLDADIGTVLSSVCRLSD